MQTFLPYPSIQASLRCLDNKRLGKQRVEAMQIINALTDGSAWSNHPAVLMWKGYIPTLKYYHNCAIDEWVARGFNNTMEKIPPMGKIIKPWYLGVSKFHASHRSNLLRKDPEFYSQWGWQVEHNLFYLWPENKNRSFRVVVPYWFKDELKKIKKIKKRR